MEALHDVYCGIQRALLLVKDDSHVNMCLISILEDAKKKLESYMNRFHRDKFARPDEKQEVRHPFEQTHASGPE
jgi:hypothetical protein